MQRRYSLLSRFNKIFHHPLYHFEFKRLDDKHLCFSKSFLKLLGTYFLIFATNLFIEAAFLVYLLVALSIVISLKLMLTTFIRSWELSIREYRSKTNWEVFMLTGVDAQTAVLSKLFALITSLWRPCLILWLIRIILLFNPAVLSILTTTQIFVLSNIRIEVIILSCGLLLAMTSLQFLFMTSCGTLAAASASSNLMSHFGRAITTYLLVIFSTIFVLFLLFVVYSSRIIYLHNAGINQNVFFSQQYTNIRDIHLMSIGIMLDTGVLSLIWVVQALLTTSKQNGVGVLTFTVISAIYIFWIWISVKLSIRGFARRGLPVKSKRRHSALTNPR